MAKRCEFQCREAPLVELPTRYRNLTLTCNSLAILLFQYNLPEEAALFLHIALRNEDYFLNNQEHLWEGRILTYLNLGYFYYR